MSASNLARSTIRVGEVASTNPQKGTVRVKFPDMDGVISYDLQVIQRKTKRDRDYWMPDIGDQVVCSFMGNGLECGFVEGAVYSDEDPPPVECQDKRHIAYADGTWCEYDRKEHKLKVHVAGDIDVFAEGAIHIKAQGVVFVNGRQVRLNDPNVPVNSAE